MGSRRESTWIPRQEGIREVVQTMKNGVALADRPRYLSYAFVHTAALNRDVIFNTMYFDQHISFDKDRRRMRRKRKYVPQIFGSRLVGIKLGSNVSTAVEWSMLADASDDEKIANIVRLANEGADFLLARPTARSCQRMCYGNRFAVEINRRLRDSGEWEKIAGPITINPIENAVVTAQYEARDQVGLDAEQAN
jgi:hypothetical protein